MQFRYIRGSGGRGRRPNATQWALPSRDFCGLETLPIGNREVRDSGGWRLPSSQSKPSNRRVGGCAMGRQEQRTHLQSDRYNGSRARPDMLERLGADPGARTLGQLLQERQWALQEIERLTDEILRLRSLSAAKPPSVEVVSETEATRRAHALRNPNRLVRMKELRHLLGLGPSTIYKMMGEGRFSRSVHLGERTTAWRLAEIEAWQAGLS